MRLNLREEAKKPFKRRDNTKGIQDVGKASTVELNRTIDTESPTMEPARTEIKRREDKAKKDPADTKKVSDEVSAKEKKSTEEQRDETIAEYQRRSNKIKQDITKLKEKDPKGYFTKALSIIFKLAQSKPAEMVGVDFSGFENEHVANTLFKYMEDKLKNYAKNARGKKVKNVEEVQAGLDALIEKLGDDLNYDLVQSVLVKNGVNSPKDFEKLSEPQRQKILDMIDVEVTEKGKDPSETPDDDEPVSESRASNIRQALQHVAEGRVTNRHKSLRTILLSMGDHVE
jgi:hypothetical protein